MIERHFDLINYRLRVLAIDWSRHEALKERGHLKLKYTKVRRSLPPLLYSFAQSHLDYVASNRLTNNARFILISTKNFKCHICNIYTDSSIFSSYYLTYKRREIWTNLEPENINIIITSFFPLFEFIFFLCKKYLYHAIIED